MSFGHEFRSPYISIQYLNTHTHIYIYSTHTVRQAAPVDSFTATTLPMRAVETTDSIPSSLPHPDCFFLWLCDDAVLLPTAAVVAGVVAGVGWQRDWQKCYPVDSVAVFDVVADAAVDIAMMNTSVRHFCFLGGEEMALMLFGMY